MMVLFYVMRDQQQTDTADNNDTKNPALPPIGIYKLIITITKFYP